MKFEFIKSEFSKAYEFARGKHGLQMRKYNSGHYIKHPLSVASILLEFGISKREIIEAALLHDTVEDTQTSFEEIEELFGTEVMNLVKQVTDVAKKSDGNRKTRKAIDLEHLSKATRDGANIKFADLIDIFL